MKTFAIAAALGVVSFFGMHGPASAAAKCASVQARCAVKIGGQCDPATGKWGYGTWMGRRMGGNAAAFNDCVSAETKSGKK